MWVKVVFISPGGHAQGGAERSLAALIAGLTERGHEVDVVMLATGDAGTLFRDNGATIAGVLADELQVAARHASLGRFVVGAAQAAPALARIGLRLRRLVDACAPDIVHSNGFRSHVLSPAVAQLGVPVVWSLRDVAPRRAHQMLLHAASVSASAIVANSDFTAQQLRHRRVEVVANPVAAVRPRDKTESRARLGLARDRHVVAMLAHLHPSKGHDVAIDALARWDRSVRPVLALAGGAFYPGSDVYRTQLVHQIERLGLLDDVVLLGAIDDVSNVYSAADVIVHPCRHPEGFGRVVVEAQSAGVPVVATNLGGVASLIRDGNTGRLIEANNATALHHAVDECLWPGPTRTRFIAQGRATARRFEPSRHVDRVEAIYLDLAGQPPRVSPESDTTAVAAPRDRDHINVVVGQSH